MVDAIEVFERRLELNPQLPSVRARLQVLKGCTPNSTAAPPNDYKINEMLDIELKLIMDEHDEPQGDDLTFAPLVEPRESDLYEALAVMFED